MFIKRTVRLLLIFTMLLGLIAVPAAAETPEDLSAEQIIQRIEDTYEAALRSAGRRRFENRCSEMVNHSLYVLGLESYAKHCDGSQEYDLYRDLEKTSSRYDVIRYSGGDYSLEEALYALSEQEEGSVYNVIACWDGGATANSSSYGHTAFIHAIVDGMVYYAESYGLSIAGREYREGQPIVCTIEEFAYYYNKWAYFEGLVYLDAPDEIPPELSAVVVREKSKDGFTLNFRARDNVEITEIYAKVWPYGGNEDNAKILPAQWKDGFAKVLVDTEDFDGFVGRYYIRCFAADEKGNVSDTTLVDGDCVNLYTSDAAEGTYRVFTSVAGVHDAPYAVVRDTGTLKFLLQEGSLLEITGQWTNEDGETWYQLSGGNWVNSAYVQRWIRWDDVGEYLLEMILDLLDQG